LSIRWRHDRFICIQNMLSLMRRGRDFDPVGKSLELTVAK